MSVIVGASAHGSPGVTTALSLMAASWPGRPTPILIEADTVGGTLAARFGLGHSPGFGTLTAALRYEDRTDPMTHCQMLPSGVPVIVGATSATTASAQLRTTAADLPSMLAAQTRPVVVDLGSLLPWAPTAPLAAEADLILWFVRPTAEELRLLYTRHREVASGANAGIVLVGDKPYDASSVEAAFDLRVVGVIPADPRGAKAANLGGDARFLRRSPLARACRSLATTAAASIGFVAEPAPELRDGPARRTGLRRIRLPGRDTKAADAPGGTSLGGAEPGTPDGRARHHEQPGPLGLPADSREEVGANDGPEVLDLDDPGGTGSGRGNPRAHRDGDDDVSLGTTEVTA